MNITPLFTAANIAWVRFPDDRQKRDEFIENYLRERCTEREFEDFIKFGEKLAIKDWFLRISSHYEKFVNIPEDRRQEPAREILSKAKQAVQRIEQGEDCMYLISKISSLCHTADRLHNEPMAKTGWEFIVGRTKRRLDALGSTMIDWIAIYKEKNGRMPGARELWNSIPTEGCIQEKDENFIYWLRKNGKEEQTSFKAFQNRLTNYKKKIEN